MKGSCFEQRICLTAHICIIAEYFFHVCIISCVQLLEEHSEEDAVEQHTFDITLYEAVVQGNPCGEERK